MYLTRGTSFGAFNFIIEEVKNHCINNLEFQKAERLNSLSKRLIESSDVAHECLSYYSQYAFIKVSKPNEYEVRLEELKKTDAYIAHKVYTIIDFLELDNWEEIFNSTLISRIARLAMNIEYQLLFNENILNEDYLVQSLLIEQGMNFNPNTRFIKLVRSLKKLLLQYSIEFITDKMLLEEANLNSIECNKERILEFFGYLRSIIIDYNYPIEPVENVIISTEKAETKIDVNRISEDDILETLDLIRPTVINTNYEHINLLNLDELQNIDGVFSSYWIIITGEQYLILFDDISFGKRYIFAVEKNTVKIALARYDLPVTVFIEDYDELLIRFPELIQKEIFIFNNEPYLSSKKFITTHLSEQGEIMFYSLNEEIIVVFIKLKDNAIFTMLHTKFSLQLIFKDIRKAIYKYINADNLIDGVFWKHDRDWWKYEDIIRSFTQTSMFNLSSGIPGLGHRILLEGF
ncbi:hypothetical protein G8C92_26720 [Paenibacillus donghaensis]|uniref:hypothetical protein n=1 Tax=Paenibacillus donghaensis TaxID=414771 RepID=UPI0018847731|nr:hypothetical protein [Paenibacillus donghaensis]MBE9917613.1 hypothetical protein [Paenibacillus donghaensis]